MKWFWKPSKKKKNNEDSCIFERCIMCGKITNVRKDTHIDFRDHYVMGSGQMCYSCYFDAYLKPNDPMDEQSMKALIEMTKRASKK